MCIYCGTTKYRAIYEKHFGLIPREENGRSYDIHHIDGDRLNNDISNLKAVTIQEHYDIHFSQSNWAACHRLASKMKLSPQAISELAKKRAIEQVKSGTHPWLGGLVQKKLAKRLIEEGTHKFLDGEWQRTNNQVRVVNGTHNFLGSSNNKQMLKDGKHSSQNPEHLAYMSKLQKENSRRRFLEGTHTFLKVNSFEWVCEYCSRQGRGKTNYDRHTRSKKCKDARSGINTID